MKIKGVPAIKKFLIFSKKRTRLYSASYHYSKLCSLPKAQLRSFTESGIFIFLYGFARKLIQVSNGQNSQSNFN
jgi:hypothetical protein